MPDLFAIYIHWPFCKAKCPYCDFNSHVADTIDHARWTSAYMRELEHVAKQTKGRNVTSIFFGGGTPSLMEAETVQKIISHIRNLWPVPDTLEITLEANPTSIEMSKFEEFREAGVNRVSIGIQSLRAQDLEFLGREHSAGEALQALETAHHVFDRVSFDLIYARPEQTLVSWKEELEEALGHVPKERGHLSLYQLTIEQGTPFYTQHARGDFQIPSSDQAGAFYELTQEIMNTHKMPAYEVSNHAHKGQESLHNVTYWRYADYAGIGPGAHGRLTIDGQKFAIRTHRAPDIWLERVETDGHGFHPYEELTSHEQYAECLMMGMRLSEGIPFERLERMAGKSWQELLSEDKLEALKKEGRIELTDTHIKPTLSGLQRVNSILSYLL
ncbi:MAG: radical SAM family heme chaperone HemW [Alphaproteobacteria bacterium]|nr:radical SAM family heme chaperone HemW [Alphaproteobacteria bacterium]